MSAVSYAEFGKSHEADGFDTFWNQYGEVSGFESPGELALIWDAARSHYDDRLKVHNFGHAKDVVWTAMRLADECEPTGTSFVNRKLIITAALFHDAGYHIDHRAFGLNSAEALSLLMLMKEPTLDRFSFTEIEQAGRLVMVTQKDMKPRTLEEKIMVRADIENIGTDSFWQRTLELGIEARQIKEAQGQIYLWDSHAENNLKALAAYLDHDLTTGGSSDEPWRRQATMNFSRYLIRTANKLGRPLKQYKAQLGGQVIRIASEGEHYVALAETEAAAETDKPTDPTVS
jgi:hypothetical protein